MRAKAIAIILKEAIENCYNKTGATQREIIKEFLHIFDIDFRLIEWHACPDGASRCIFCGDTAPKHKDDCPWIS